MKLVICFNLNENLMSYFIRNLMTNDKFNFNRYIKHRYFSRLSCFLYHFRILKGMVTIGFLRHSGFLKYSRKLTNLKLKSSLSFRCIQKTCYESILPNTNLVALYLVTKFSRNYKRNDFLYC